MTIPVLGLWQPYASLLALQEKRVETRAFPAARFRIKPGPLAIHAAKKWDAETRGCFNDPEFFAAFYRHDEFRLSGGNPAWKFTNLPLGAIIAVMDFKASYEMRQCGCFTRSLGAVPTCERCNGTGMRLGAMNAQLNEPLVTPKECNFGDWHPGPRASRMGYGRCTGIFRSAHSDSRSPADRLALGVEYRGRKKVSKNLAFPLDINVFVWQC